ncbi:uncharacterized protein [Prorops nasuta]|uniref:uncharacterized protein n=1 Tax=Prorops nasuta TaxID=863751 RepID=UPI0034CD6988
MIMDHSYVRDYSHNYEIAEWLNLVLLVYLDSIDGAPVLYDSTEVDHETTYPYFVNPIYHLNPGHYYDDHEYGQEDYQDYYAYPRYAYNYGVYGPYTDIKTQHEIQDGDVILGSYDDDDDDSSDSDSSESDSSESDESDEFLNYLKYAVGPHDNNLIAHRYGDIVQLPIAIPVGPHVSKIADGVQYEKQQQQQHY